MINRNIGLLSQPRRGAAAEPLPDPNPALKTGSVSPLGIATDLEQLANPVTAAAVTKHFSRLTPELSMKMEYIIPDGRNIDFTRPDQLVAWADNNGLDVFGHTLVWYDTEPELFTEVEDDPEEFLLRYQNYIDTVVKRYSQITHWDVVNEPIRDDGQWMRENTYTRALGDVGHIEYALAATKNANPDAVTYIQDYNLEYSDSKRGSFKALVAALQSAEAALDRIGTQTHPDWDLPSGEFSLHLTDLSTLGLPIHISEIDISLGPDVNSITQEERAYRRGKQIALLTEITESYLGLPEALRGGITFWGVRDEESWYNVLYGRTDEPCLFDNQGLLKTLGRNFQYLIGL